MRVTIAAVIFDMDGLMLDTEKLSKHSWYQAVAQYGYTFEEDVYQQLVGRGIADVERILHRAFGMDFPFQDVLKDKMAFFDMSIDRDGVPVKPGLLGLLDFLDAVPLPKAVASSSYRDVVTRRLTGAGLKQRFEAVVCGDDIQNGKPSPDIFLEAAARLGVLPSVCVVLEDSDAGILAAHQAGMLPVLVPDLKIPGVETIQTAYKVFDSLFEVREFLALYI